MCGICGMVNFSSGINKSLIKKMNKILKHRGPDDEGYFFDKNIGMGNRRLSIIDIKSGHQPIHNEDKTMWVIHNGEIYNFQELRKILEKKHRFYTNSDTEVIVHAYEEWREKCVNKFNGMWAFVVWDSRRKRLFLSRDRFGEKPLYYYFDGKKFVFASEIKAILQDKTIEKTPNDKIIYEYLVHGLHDHTEDTFFDGIKKLLPAHYMILDKNDMKIKRYWNFKVNKNFDFSSDKDKEYAKKFYQLLEDSIRLRLISEVPIGTCLSGGLDSTSVALIINKLLISEGVARDLIGEKQKTFSAVYNDKKIDERKYIEEVAKATGIEKNYVFPKSKKLWKEIKKLVYHQDEPFGGTSIYAQWNVMRLSRKKVKVVLDGQGGDELLAGYIPYYGIYFFNLWKKRKLFHLLKEFVLSLNLTLPFIKKFILESKKELDIKKMLDAAFVSKFDQKVRTKWKGNDLADFLYLEMTQNSIPRLLRYEDKNAMAFSIESRVPFLDHRIAEFIFSLPINQRIKNGWTKYVLRNAMKGIIPEKIRKRRSKIGFATPEVEWMRSLKKDIRNVFVSKKFGNRKYFNQKEILKKFDEFCEVKSDDYASVFWRILNLEIWFRVFFDGK
jgi:asparagine synthase (glutamine-hydrolysing)